MRLYPFRGIRYSDALAAGGRLAAPPYDQIDDDLASRLREDPHQFAWLTRPMASDLGDSHQAARRTHLEWLDDGTLQKDESPSLYPYEILLRGGGCRLGLTALVGLEDPEEGVIRPHEETVERTVGERLDLLRATEVDLEPILLLSDDDGGLDSLLAEDVADSEALVEHRDPFGNRHRLFRLHDATRIERYRSALESVPGLIADGHHRYEVALRHAADLGLERRSEQAAKLAVVTSLKAPGLTIDPIHRGLAETVDLDSAAGPAKGRRTCDAASGVTMVAAASTAKQPAFVVYSPEHKPELWSFAQRESPADISASARHLAVAWLHEVVLPRLGLETEAARDGRIAYRSDPEQLLSEVNSGELATGIFLPPMSPQDFSLATAGRALLPPKSTRFLPKLVSGLVWVSLRDRRE